MKNYCQPSLHLLRLDEFDYPKLHFWTGEESYGNLDSQEEVKLFFSQMFAGRMTDHYVFHGYPYNENLDEIRKFVRWFNSNLKENWDNVIFDLLSKQEAATIREIASRKDSLKTVRRTMKKFSTGKG